MFDEDFFLITADFVKSSQDLADAAALCEHDPIKQDMVMYIYKEFEAIQARSEGIKLLVKRGYSENRDFILDEMKEIIKRNYKMAAQVRNTLEGLL